MVSAVRVDHNNNIHEIFYLFLAILARNPFHFNDNNLVLRKKLTNLEVAQGLSKSNKEHVFI